MSDFRGVAVLGSGMWGSNHVRVWHELEVLKAVCDPDRSRLQKVTETCPGVVTTTDVDALMARDDISAVVIATPAFTHRQLALQAMQAGKDVLIEKPMALTVEEGEEVLALAAETDRIVAVGHVLEYHPAILKLAELIGNGTLGRLHYMYSNRLNMGRIRTEENSLWSFAPHDIAIMLRLIGTSPTEVACHGGEYLNRGIADVTLTHLAFQNGIRSHIFVSWLHPFKEQRFVVMGDQQMAVFSDTVGWDEKLVLYPHRVDWLGGQVPVARKSDGVPVELEPHEPLTAQCEHVLECWRTRTQPLTDGKSALEVLKVLHRAQRALEGHSSVLDETVSAGSHR